MPSGTYSNVCVGKVDVYAVITYDPEKEIYYLDTFNVLDETIRGKRMYTPFSYNTANISYSEGFDLTFITDNPETPDNVSDGIINEITAEIESVYYVNYEANGGNGKMLTSLFGVDEKVTLLKNSFTRAGYKFLGWGLTADGGAIYSDGSEVENLTSRNKVITLYAIWEPIPHALSYTATGVGYTISVSRTASAVGGALGELASGSTVYYGDVLDITYSIKTGYTLATKGETKITVLNDDITSDLIYATATVNTYRVTYNSNGGEGSTSDSSHTYNVVQSLTANGFSRTGWEFIGWSTSPNGTVEYTDQQSVKNLSKTNGDIVTLYAIWNLKTYYADTISCYDTITDSDSSIHYVRFKQLYFLDLNALQSKYNNAKITISFKAIEIDKGYQEVYICSGDAVEDRITLYSETALETAGSGTPGSQDWTFTTTTSSTNIYDYTFILFGCHGDGDDDWILNDLSFRLEFY